jgi:hypothetical protein
MGFLPAFPLSLEAGLFAGCGLPSFLAGGVKGRYPWFGFELSLALGAAGLFPPEGFDPLEFWGEFGGFFAFGGVKGRNPWFDRGLSDLELFDLELSRALGEVSGRFTGVFELFEFAGVKGRLPGVAGPRASRGEIAGG